MTVTFSFALTDSGRSGGRDSLGGGGGGREEEEDGVAGRSSEEDDGVTGRGSEEEDGVAGRGSEEEEEEEGGVDFLERKGEMLDLEDLDDIFSLG